MPRGGARPGAGRKPGSINKKTREIAEKAAQEGITPLEVMLGTMRVFWEKAEAGAVEASGVEGEGGKVYGPLDFRMMAADVAQKAAPYVHPKLSNIEARLEGEVGLKVEIVRFGGGKAHDSTT